MNTTLCRIFVVIAVSLLALGAGPTSRPSTKPATTQAAASATSINLKTLGNFDFDQTSGTINDLPKSFQDLDGKRVTFVGEMWCRAELGEKVTRFEAVYSKTKWSFRGPPCVQDFFKCKTADNAGVTYIEAPVRIVGILHIKVEKTDDGYIGSLYTVDVESLQPVDGKPTPAVAPRE